MMAQEGVEDWQVYHTKHYKKITKRTDDNESLNSENYVGYNYQNIKSKPGSQLFQSAISQAVGQGIMHNPPPPPPHTHSHTNSNTNNRRSASAVPNRNDNNQRSASTYRNPRYNQHQTRQDKNNPHTITYKEGQRSGSRQRSQSRSQQGDYNNYYGNNNGSNNRGRSRPHHDYNGPRSQRSQSVQKTWQQQPSPQQHQYSDRAPIFAPKEVQTSTADPQYQYNLRQRDADRSGWNRESGHYDGSNYSMPGSKVGLQPQPFGYGYGEKQYQQSNGRGRGGRRSSQAGRSSDYSGRSHRGRGGEGGRGRNGAFATRYRDTAAGLHVNDFPPLEASKQSPVKKAESTASKEDTQKLTDKEKEELEKARQEAEEEKKQRQLAEEQVEQLLKSTQQLLAKLNQQQTHQDEIELEKNQLLERVAYLEKLDEPDTMDNQGRISSFAYYNDTDLSYLDENYAGDGAGDDDCGDLDPEQVEVVLRQQQEEWYAGDEVEGLVKAQ